MKINIKNIHFKFLYIFFIILSLNIFFFSTAKIEAKAFEIDNIDISRPFKIDFNKNDVINDGFKKAFFELILLIVKSSDQKKIKNIKLNEIKGMIDSFTIKEEKFVDEIYYVNLGVSFNKKKIFQYLEKRNIFASIPLRKKFLFIPIIIDEKEKDLLIFYDNRFYDNWNNLVETYHLIEYILPTEDLEDLSKIKKEYDNIEQYNFNEITKKYDLDNSIITLIFVNDTQVRILSRLTAKDNTILKNQSFSNIDINDEKQFSNLIKNLKIVYEDYWKDYNEINTSIKLILKIKVDNNDSIKASNFEKALNKTDLVYDFYISKFDKKFTYYEIVFNNTPNVFLKSMKDYDYNFDIQNKIWTLKWES